MSINDSPAKEGLSFEPLNEYTKANGNGDTPLLLSPMVEEKAPDSTRRFSWKRWLVNIGPGLVCMLADTDAGCLITASQSGAQWGYAILIWQIILIPPLYMAQELTVRLGAVSKHGLTELIRKTYGRAVAAVCVFLLVLTCAGAITSEMTGLVGVGNIWGAPKWSILLSTVVVLSAVVLSGSYERVEKIALIMGLCECVFIATMILSKPDPVQMAEGLTKWPVQKPSYLYLVAANIGAVIMPWMVFYQQSAVVDKGVDEHDIKYAKVDTVVGAFITQLIMAATLITSAAAVWKPNVDGPGFKTVDEISSAITPHLGDIGGKVLFSLGMAGGALIGAVVTSLTAAWAVGELLGMSRSLGSNLKQAPWFYAIYAAMLGIGVIACVIDIDNVKLNVFIQITNALLMPGVVGLLFSLACKLPEPHTLKGVQKYLYALTFAIVALISVGSVSYGLATGIATE